MTKFIGWIQFAGKRILVEWIDEEPLFHVVRLCTAYCGFSRGQVLRVPRGAFERCSSRGIAGSRMVLS
jgi:hypothetical protein